MLHIVTDGAADVPTGWEKEYDINIIPINIHIGDKTFLQNVDIDNEAFYRLVDESRKIPKTSQPSPHQFMELYKRIAKKSDTILSIHVTSKLSGTYASAIAAAEELKNLFKVVPFDSAAGSLVLGLMCREARRMDRAGKSLEQIVKYLENVRERIHIILTLDKLEYAHMSGRIGALSVAFASALNVKPIAVLKNGVVQVVEKVRTRKASLDRIIEMAVEQAGTRPIYLGILHARDVASGRVLTEAAKKCFNLRDLIMTEMSISLAANLGPGTVGLVVYPAD
jgi:DegV family protein with EDD domain